MVDITIKKTELTVKFKKIWRDRNKYCLPCSHIMDRKKSELWIIQDEIEQYQCGKIHQIKNNKKVRKRLQLNKKLNNIINYRVYSIFITQISDKHKIENFAHYTLYIIIIQKYV